MVTKYQELVEVFTPNNSKPETKDFATLNDLQKYLNSDEIKDVLKNLGVKDFSYGFSFEDIANTIFNKHKEDFASVTKQQLAEEFKAEYDKKVKEAEDAENTKETDETDKTEEDKEISSETKDFATFNDLQKYLISNEMKTTLKNMGVSNFNYGFTYETIANTVAAKHQSDFASVTKDQLAQEFKTEYDKKVKEFLDAQKPKTDFNTLMMLNNYVEGEEFKTRILSQLGVTEDEFAKNCGQEFSKLAKELAKSHEKDYNYVTKLQLINEMVAKYNVFTEAMRPINPTPKNGDFATFNELQAYLISSEMRNTVTSLGITNFNYGFAYEAIASIVAAKHENDFASVTKQQLAEEFKTEYDKKVKEFLDAQKPKTDFNTHMMLNNYVESEEFKTRILSQLGVTEDEFAKNCGQEFSKLTRELVLSHYKDYNYVTKRQLINEMVAKYNSLVETQPTRTPNTTTKGDFTTFNELQMYLVSAEMKAAIANIGINNFYRFSYEMIASMVVVKHEDDYTSVTKEQLIREFQIEYYKKMST